MSARPTQAYRLRCYLRQLPSKKWLGVCVTLNLVVEAATKEAAKTKLEGLIADYVEDAIEHDEVKAYIPRRAPFAFLCEYAYLWLTSLLHARPSSQTFVEETSPLQHA